MKIVVFIAPSKTFKKTNKRGSLTPLFSEKTAILENQIRQFTRLELANKMKLSPKLSEEVFLNFNSPFKARALDLFSGVSYKAMDSDTLVVKSNQLYIIDAYYGLIRPDDDISTYRLDFTMSFLGNLYSYWRDTIFNYINKNHNNDILIDLTSKEFSSLIPETLNKYRIDFINKNKPLTSVTLKKIRGIFTRYIIDHKLNTVEAIKEIKIEGFCFDPQSSDNKTIVFSL